jgi:glycosyltransferase involved in cell wall biosynthesis
MKIACVCTGFYPEEHAAAVRHSLLAKGLVELGHEVDFYILEPQNWNGKKQVSQHGVNYTEMNAYRGGNKIIKHLNHLRCIYKTKNLLVQRKKANALDAVILFTVDVPAIKVLLPTLKKLNVKTFCDRTELPYVFAQKKIFASIYLKLLPLFDGIFVINDKLDAYIRQFNTNTKKLLTVVDLSFFKPATQPSPYDFPYIGYCGTIQGVKDGVPILIEAFAKITHHFPGLKLLLVGNNKNKELIKDTLDTIAKFSLDDKVVFTGHVSREIMPVLLGNAQILVVSKPDNEQNSGNFPIKIGEYLATGVPIVVTSVGEIPMFIKDGESGFLALPNSADSFAEKMKEALSNKQRAKAIGLAGKAVAEKNFDYRHQAKIMTDYITEIQKKY